MSFLTHLTDDIKCKGETFTLTSDLKSPHITLTNKLKPSECNVVGFTTFEKLLQLDEKLNTGNLLRVGLQPEMISKDWEHLFGIRVSGKGDDVVKVALVLCDHNYLLERVTRQLILPLQLTQAALTSLGKEALVYAKGIQERENNKKLSKLATELMSLHDISYEQAMSRLKGEG